MLGTHVRVMRIIGQVGMVWSIVPSLYKRVAVVEPVVAVGSQRSASPLFADVQMVAILKRQAKADVVVRITGDCPVIDPALIDDCVKALLEGSFDFTCNRLPPPFTRTYPIGLDTEVCTFEALEKAWNESTETFHREHVMPYLYEGAKLSAISSQLSEGISKRGFKIAQLHHDPDYGQMRWTVDTLDDLEFMREVYARFGGDDEFTWQDVLHLVQKEPELVAINSAVRHKTLYDK